MSTRYLRFGTGFLFAAVMILSSFSAHGTGVFQNLFGRKGLPVYHVPRGNPQAWVHKNAVHFLKVAPDFSVINRNINPQLSSACALGRFNQRRDKEFFIVARQHRKNVVILGYAHGRGVNLHDPGGIADQSSGYLFRYDKSGKCQVFTD